MRFLHSILFLLLTQTINGETVLKDIHAKWQSFYESSIIYDYGFRLISDPVYLFLGEGEDISKTRILAVNISENKIYVHLQFHQTILDVTEIIDLEKSDKQSSEVIHQLKLPVLNKYDEYQVELYGVQKSKTSKGEELNEQDDRSLELFARFSLLRENLWLKKNREKLEIKNQLENKISKFLKKPLKDCNIEVDNFEELVGHLRDRLAEGGYNLLYLPNHKVIQQPIAVDKNKAALKIKPVNFRIQIQEGDLYELLTRICFIGNFCYRVAPKGVIISTREVFEKSKLIENNEKLKLPGLEVNVKTSKVYLDARVCMSSGILEYLMCLPHSFEHESIFVTKVRPELLHTSLLLIKAEPLPYKQRSDALKKLVKNPSRLKIEVQWLENGKIKRVTLEKLLIARSNKKKMTFADDRWFFAGSYFTKNNTYAANSHQSVISLLKHPASVIHYGASTEDPHYSDQSGFEINDRLCPPTGTDVKLVFSVQP